MSQSATPATQNHMTTCLETFEKERFCSFPHRHSEAAGKPAIRDDTWEQQNEHFLRDSLQFHSWKPSKRRGFAASPIDTARPQENQQLETRHVGAAKRAFPARLPPALTLCSPPSPSTLATQKNFTKGCASQDEVNPSWFETVCTGNYKRYLHYPFEGRKP